MAQVTSGSFTTSAYSGRSIKFSWSLKSQSIKDNTSTIEWTFAGSGTGTSWFYTQNSYLNINGARVYTQNGTAPFMLRYEFKLIFSSLHKITISKITAISTITPTNEPIAIYFFIFFLLSIVSLPTVY